MSDYNLVSSETLQAKPRADIAGFFILADFYTLNESLRIYEYNKSINSGLTYKDKQKMLADLKVLYYKIKNHYIKKNKLKAIEVEGYLNDTKQHEDEKTTEIVLELFRYLEEDLGLTKIATRGNYDRTNIVKSNKHHGY